MPGVPKSSSCDACLKQKKKCDQGRPQCGRCSRLQIPCVGAGVRRYKFLTVDGHRGRGVTSLVVSSASPLPSRSPDNTSTRLLAELVGKLSVDDVSYNVCFTYGPLLRELPKRLGESAALDAAVVALNATIRDLSAGRRSMGFFKSYGNALSVLGTTLQDPKIARSSLTFCAIFVVWICQGWTGGDQSNSKGHAAGILQLLEGASAKDFDDPFEKQVLGTVLGSVTFEGAFDQSIRMEPWMQDLMLGDTREISVIKCLLRFSDFIQYNPKLLPLIREHYEAMMAKMHKQNAEMDISIPDHAPRDKVDAFTYRSTATIAGVAITLNGILLAYDPLDDKLQDQSEQLHERIMCIASKGCKWLPLAASWIPLALEFAWMATTDTDRRKEIKDFWEQHLASITDAPLSVSTQFNAAFDRLRLEAGLRYRKATSELP